MIQFDNAAGPVASGGVLSQVLAHTVGTGSNRILFCGALVGGLPVVTATYGAASMTLITSALVENGSYTLYLFALLNPTSGTQNITVTSSLSELIRVASVSYSGVNQSLTLDNYNTEGPTSASTTFAETLVTVANNCWTLLWARSTGGSILAGANTTLRTSTGQSGGLLDSNAPITPAGSNTLNATSASGVWTAIMASFAPPLATTYTFTGPSSGTVNQASANFTVSPNGSYAGTITLTPTGTASTGLSATTLTFNGDTPQTFTITPTVTGSITLTPTNNKSLSNPANLTYVVNDVSGFNIFGDQEFVS